MAPRRKASTVRAASRHERAKERSVRLARLAIRMKKR
jgi:hypothetical protein